MSTNPTTQLTAKEVRDIVRQTLIEKACTDISFAEPLKGEEENVVVATFNCKDLTSFHQPIAGWTYTGIHLDPTGERQYKIDFIRIR